MRDFKGVFVNLYKKTLSEKKAFNFYFFLQTKLKLKHINYPFPSLQGNGLMDPSRRKNT